jgi:hypothetical protein
MALRLPVSVYRYDTRSKQYVFQACLQFTVQCATMPGVLTSRSGQCLLNENTELLKTVMRAPAVMLQKGTKVCIYNVSCEEVPSLPPTEPVRVIRAFELPYLNVSTQIAHYRLRGDGALVLVDMGRIQCAMCHIPDRMDQAYVREHLRRRRDMVRKLLRDRRIVVEMGERTSVYSCETLLLGKRV